MSKFVDRLKRVSPAAPQPIGFRAAQPDSTKLKIQLVASLADGNIEGLADYVAGADAVLLSVAKMGAEAKNLKQISQAVSEIPWGSWLGDGAKEEIKQLLEAGCDFVVFPAASTPLAIPQDDKVGKILQVAASLSEGLLRAVNELPVDAVFITAEEEEKGILTWHQLMLFQRFADLLTKPLLVSIPSNVAAKELQVLWEAGVDGVVVETGAGEPAGAVKGLRQVIDGVTFPSPRRREKSEAVLPRIEGDSEAVAEIEEEDD